MYPGDAHLLDRFGPPPRVLWIRCGNTSNDHVKVVIRQTFPAIVKLLAAGEAGEDARTPW
jgi:predicted nuclease of predicted toxin-antitoxin system